jgi:hypothetical protein
MVDDRISPFATKEDQTPMLPAWRRTMLGLEEHHADLRVSGMLRIPEDRAARRIRESAAPDSVSCDDAQPAKGSI